MESSANSDIHLVEESNCNKNNIHRWNNKIILINDSEFLNLNSANALLKVIEEPNDNTIIMLIQNSSKNILDTLKSRFITFNFKLNFDQVLNTTNKLLNINIEDYISNEAIQPLMLRLSLLVHCSAVIISFLGNFLL